MQAEPYNTQPQATEHHSKRIGIDRTYLRNVLGGILRLIECGLDLVVIITASINLYWLYAPLGGGWVEFVAVFGLILSFIIFCFHLFNLVARLPAWWPLFEFCYAVVMSVLYLTVFIVAAVRASQLDASVAVCAAFSFLALGAYAVDAYFSGVAWRVGAKDHARSGAQGQPTAVVVTNSYSVGGQAQAPEAPAPAPVQGGFGVTAQTTSYNANTAWGDQTAY